MLPLYIYLFIYEVRWGTWWHGWLSRYNLEGRRFDSLLSLEFFIDVMALGSTKPIKQ